MTIMNQVNNIFSFTKDLKEAILKMAKFFCEISNADRVYFTGYNSLKNFFSPINGVRKVENNFEKLDKIYFVEEFYLGKHPFSDITSLNKNYFHVIDKTTNSASLSA